VSGTLDIGGSQLEVSWFLLLGAALFTLGAVGVLVRRNPLIILISIELMLNAVNLTLVAFSRQLENLEGQRSPRLRQWSGSRSWSTSSASATSRTSTT
jgi:multisubunit Na+/H+ antiporter MnhC subunit